jgi:hypothetical protein
MKRAVLTAAIALALCGHGAQAATPVRGTAPAEARIVDPVGINVVSPLFLPNVTPNGIAAVASVASASGMTVGAAALNMGNATLTILRQTGGAVSMSVPESFTVVRTGGTESLTVNTSTNSQFGVGSDGVLLGGVGLAGNTMSVNVQGQLATGNERLVPGPYEGLLVVVVQYN